MKKLMFSFIFLLFIVVSCGPTTKEIEENRIVDSIYTADSIALIQKNDIVTTIQVDSVEINP